MKNNVIFLAGLLFIFTITSCLQTSSDSSDVDLGYAMLVNDRIDEIMNFSNDSTGHSLLQNNCMSCHSAIGKTHDQLIAPPIEAVKRRYMVESNAREDFIDNIVTWAKDPQKDKGLMRGAINKFETMPYLGYKEEDLRKIAAFIFDNEMQKPEWFEDHFNEKHPDGFMLSGKKSKGKLGMGQTKNLNKSKGKGGCKGDCGGDCKGNCKGKCKEKH